MSPRMHVKRPFHVIAKHMMATETSVDYQPGNKCLLCGLSTHRTEIFSVIFSCFSRFQENHTSNRIHFILTHLQISLVNRPRRLEAKSTLSAPAGLPVRLTDDSLPAESSELGGAKLYGLSK